MRTTLIKAVAYAVHFCFLLVISLIVRRFLEGLLPLDSILGLALLIAVFVFTFNPVQSLLRTLAQRFLVRESNLPHPPDLPHEQRQRPTTISVRRSLSGMRRLNHLDQATASLASTVEDESMFTQILEGAMKLIDTEAAAFMLADQESGELECKSVAGAGSLDLIGKRYAPGVGLAGIVARSKRSILINPGPEEADFDQLLGVTSGVEMRSVLTAPLLHRGSIIGVIQLINKRGDVPFGDHDQMLLATFNRQAAAALAYFLLLERLYSAHMAKSEFISIVSHALKTPLTSMLGYTDLLLSGVTGDLNPQQTRFLETIAANVERMGNHIHDLTDISRLESGQLQLKRKPTSLTDVFTETLPSAGELFQEREIELHLDMPSHLPSVLADRERLAQVITILLNNAGNYSPSGSEISLCVKAEPVALPENGGLNPGVVCSIRDNGYGISEDDQKRLFSKFFRSDDPNIRKVKGIGLGLSIAKAIVQSHEGKIWAESKLGEGSTFRFALPQMIAPASQRAEQQ